MTYTPSFGVNPCNKVVKMITAHPFISPVHKTKSFVAFTSNSNAPCHPSVRSPVGRNENATRAL